MGARDSGQTQPIPQHSPMNHYEHNEKTESNLLGACLIDGAIIDKAVAQGITANHFASPYHREQFAFLCELRLAGRDTTAEGLYAAASCDLPRLQRMGGMGAVVLHQAVTTLHSGDYIRAILDIHSKRAVYKLLATAVDSIKDGGGDLNSVREAAEKSASICAGNGAV